MINYNRPFLTEVPFASLSKLFIWKCVPPPPHTPVSFSFKSNSFSKDFWPWIHFETEAQGYSEMACSFCSPTQQVILHLQPKCRNLLKVLARMLVLKVVSSLQSNYFENIPHKWKVLFACTDWLARRWLAKYYSPPSSWWKTKSLLSLYFHEWSYSLGS